jgi:hypothetical protein
MSNPYERRCPKCYLEISDSATKCPHCTADIGYQHGTTDNMIITGIKLMWLVFLVLFILANTPLIECDTPERQSGFFGILSITILIQLYINKRRGINK